jgi:hypothetical protein
MRSRHLPNITNRDLARLIHWFKADSPKEKGSQDAPSEMPHSHLRVQPLWLPLIRACQAAQGGELINSGLRPESLPMELWPQ